MIENGDLEEWRKANVLKPKNNQKFIIAFTLSSYLYQLLSDPEGSFIPFFTETNTQKSGQRVFISGY